MHIVDGVVRFIRVRDGHESSSQVGWKAMLLPRKQARMHHFPPLVQKIKHLVDSPTLHPSIVDLNNDGANDVVVMSSQGAYFG